MKKIISLLLFGMMVLGFTACGKNVEATSTGQNGENMKESNMTVNTSENFTDNGAKTGSHVLVAVFSATGTTKGVAEKIVAVMGADLYEIKPAQEYTSADLNWGNPNSRSSLEQNDPSVRPEIEGEPLSLEGYDTIYIGYPIWWGEEPRVVDTFVESYDFDGITLIPFCTSGGSGVGRSDKNLAERAGSGNWLSGERFSSSVSESEIQSRIDKIKR